MSVFSTLIGIDHSISRSAIAWTAENQVIRGIMWLGANNLLLKGGVPATVYWYLWFRDADQPIKRSQLIATLPITVIAICIGRALANLLPFRLRPIGSAEIVGENVEQNRFLEAWSAMPSDHAVMFFTLAGCFFLLSHSAGIFLFLHAAFFVCAARVFLGLHFPSDVVVGAVVGITIAFILMSPSTRFVERLRGKTFCDIPPKIGYALLFLATFQFATMFDSARDLANKLSRFFF